MKIHVSDSNPEKIKTELLILIKEGKKDNIDIIKDGKYQANRVMEITSRRFRLKDLRSLGAKATNTAREFNLKEFAIVFPKVEDITDSAQALTEGLILSSYDFKKFKTKKGKGPVESATILSEKSKELMDGVRIGEIISEHVIVSRDFVNDPSNHNTPTAFANNIAKISKKNGLKVKIYSKKEMEKMGMGCLLGVAQGSRQEPKMVVVEYKGLKSKEFYALVGKGITFDSGGISLKPSQSMHEMKGDMSGGASVIGTINAIAKLKLPVNITAIVPCVENMPGGNAMKPGDVLLSMSGKTVEVLNTDAEGRLILADALHFIAEKNPKAIIDMATLTGACVVSLGYNIAGMMGSDDKLMDAIFEAGGRTNERIWKMPLYKEFSRAIKSDIADIKNMGHDNGAAGSLTAGAFLKEFVDKTPWVHMDVAGTYWSKENKDHDRKGSTGWGVRLLVDLFRNI